MTRVNRVSAPIHTCMRSNAKHLTLFENCDRSFGQNREHPDIQPGHPSIQGDAVRIGK